MKIPLLTILVLLLASCRDNPVDPFGRLDEMPSGVGSYWKYAVVDTISQEKDTVEVSVISVNSFNQGKIARWKFKNLYKIDTLSVIYAADTIYAGLSSFSQNYRVAIITPLEVGKEYITPYGLTQVLSIDTILNKNETFTDSYHLYNPFESSEQINNVSYWIKPGIGIVKVHRSFTSLVGLPQQEVFWQLLDYNILE